MDRIPTYLMPLFPIRSCVEKTMRSQFLWEGKFERKKFHFVKWKKVIQDKESDGLGVKSLKLHNKSLLLKCLWRWNENGEEMRKQHIDTTWGREVSWTPCKEVSMPAKTGLSEHISWLWPKFLKFLYWRLEIGVSQVLNRFLVGDDIKWWL